MQKASRAYEVLYYDQPAGGFRNRICDFVIIFVENFIMILTNMDCVCIITNGEQFYHMLTNKIHHYNAERNTYYEKSNETHHWNRTGCNNGILRNCRLCRHRRHARQLQMSDGTRLCSLMRSVRLFVNRMEVSRIRLEARFLSLGHLSEVSLQEMPELRQGDFLAERGNTCTICVRLLYQCLIIMRKKILSGSAGQDLSVYRKKCRCIHFIKLDSKGFGTADL